VDLWSDEEEKKDSGNKMEENSEMEEDSEQTLSEIIKSVRGSSKKGKEVAIPYEEKSPSQHDGENAEEKEKTEEEEKVVAEKKEASSIRHGKRQGHCQDCF